MLDRRSLAILGLALAVLARSGTAQIVYPNDSTCRTPKGEKGVCTNVKTCPAMLALLQKQPLSQATVEYLRKSQCGFERLDPKVCCPHGSGTTVTTTTTTTSTTTEQPLDDTKVPDVSNHPNVKLLDHQNCGPISADKIINGQEAGLFEIPWMALLAYDTGRGQPQFRCGGSILNRRHVLTAAHCVTNLGNLKLAGVRVGEHDITKELDCNEDDGCAEKYQDFKIESVKSHEKYSATNLHNDIAIIRVDADIDFRPASVRPVCMPLGSSATIRSKKLMVTGWGVTEQRISSPTLQKITLPVYPQQDCKETYKAQTDIWHKQICVGGEPGRDSCSGDSGGPLVAPAVYQGNPRYVQYGVVSFGVKLCGTQGFPGVYTRVDYYLDWILNNMRA